MSPVTRADRKPNLWRCLGSGLYRWKGTLAVLAGCGLLLWHVLACVESPMAFSPQGDLAFTTVTPDGAARDKEAADSPPEESREVSRLFVLPKGERTLRLIEATDDHYLCAPAYSPDGKTLSYLRVPQRRGEPKQEQREPEPRSQKSDHSSPPPLVSAEGYRFEDLSVPSVWQTQESFRKLKDEPRTEVTLVSRDVASGEVRSTTKLNIPLPKSDGDEAVILTYTLGSVKYGPKGEWIYLCAVRLVLAVHPARKEIRLLAAPDYSAALSPDGKVVATMSENEMGFFETGGPRGVFARFEQDVALASTKGFAWLDNDHLAVLTTQGKNGPLSLALVRRDGTIAKSIKLPIDEAEEYWEELAVSPDGKRVAIAAKTALYFLDAEGHVVSQWKEEGISASSPTFSPDSQQLACKLAPEEDEGYCRAIAFFSPDGKELFRIDIPQKPEK